MILITFGFIAIVVVVALWVSIMWHPPSRLGEGRLHHSALSGVPRSHGAGPVSDPEAEAYALKKKAERRAALK
jgi:hypothetical protein